VGWSDIDRLDRKRDFVSRARKRGIHAEPGWGYEDMSLSDYSLGMHNTGFVFGRDKKKASSLSCTIYNKTEEIKRSGKDWFYDLYRSRGWSEEDGPIWRVEMRYKREALHELMQEGNSWWGVEDAYTLPDLLPLLWAYAVGHVDGGEDGLPDGWLRCVVPNGDKNRSRWPAHPAWKVVQGAFSESQEVPEHFGKIVRKRHRDNNIEKALEGILGYATSISAWVGEELAHPDIDLSMFLHWLAVNGSEHLERREMDFGAEVQRKRVKFGLQIK
jgi:hypothetical protein